MLIWHEAEKKVGNVYTWEAENNVFDISAWKMTS